MPARPGAKATHLPLVFFFFSFPFFRVPTSGFISCQCDFEKDIVWDGADSKAKPLTLRQKLMRRREMMAQATEGVAKWREEHPDKVRKHGDSVLFCLLSTFRFSPSAAWRPAAPPGEAPTLNPQCRAAQTTLPPLSSPLVAHHSGGGGCGASRDARAPRKSPLRSVCEGPWKMKRASSKKKEK